MRYKSNFSALFAALFSVGFLLCSLVSIPQIIAAPGSANQSPNECLPPQFAQVPATIVYKNHCSAYTFNFDATEGGNNPAALPVTYSASNGDINPATGEFSVQPEFSCSSEVITIVATNSCGAESAFDFTLVWVNHPPHITNFPVSPIGAPSGLIRRWDFNSTDSDPCDAAVWSVLPVGSVVNPPTITGSGLFSWLPDSSEQGSEKSFVVTLGDQCGPAQVGTIDLEVPLEEPFVLMIKRTQMAKLGNVEQVSIAKNFGTGAMGGYNLLISYNANVLSPMSALPGAGINECGWEYFTYSLVDHPNCGATCPVGLIRLVAVADLNNGSSHPQSLNPPNGSDLATIKFYVALDRAFDCNFLPVRFAWLSCNDNVIAMAERDSLWISSQVFDFGNPNPWIYVNDEITDLTCLPDISYSGACADCESPSSERNIIFGNGGIDLMCDYYPSYGDINLNGIAFDVGDATLLASYFTYGLGVFRINVAEQIAQSDANYDGLVLTPADLVYLLRVIVGDAQPFPKLEPFHSTATVTQFGPETFVESSEKIAAVYLKYDIIGDYRIESLCDMEVSYGEHDGQLHVLVWSGLDAAHLTDFLDAGNSSLVRVTGAALAEAQVSDYYGNLLKVKRLNMPLPEKFALGQNYPNPFNPVTRIDLDIPIVSDWTLEIFNVTGQLVKSYSGTGRGVIPVEWDGSASPSGVYLYRLKAGSFSDTRKMLLLK